MAPHSQDVTASVFFISKDEIYLTEKPYSLTSTARHLITDTLPATNVIQGYESFAIKDLRGIEKDLT